MDRYSLKDMFKLALRAWFVGLLSAGLIILPIMTALSGSLDGPIWEQLAWRVVALIGMVPFSLLTVSIFGVLLTWLLFLIAFATSLMFAKQIAQRPLPFILLAPAITAVLVTLWDTLSRNNDWARSHDFWERFGHIMMSWETLLYAFPVLVSAVYFCNRIKLVRPINPQPSTAGLDTSMAHRDHPTGRASIARKRAHVG